MYTNMSFDSKEISGMLLGSFCNLQLYILTFVSGNVLTFNILSVSVKLQQMFARDCDLILHYLNLSHFILFCLMLYHLILSRLVLTCLVLPYLIVARDP